MDCLGVQVHKEIYTYPTQNDSESETAAVILVTATNVEHRPWYLFRHHSAKQMMNWHRGERQERLSGRLRLVVSQLLGDSLVIFQ
jgi:hypothetical protein